MYSSSRRRFLGAAAGAALSVVGHRPGFAQQFPARGILVIVPYAAGGGSDVSARLLARDLEPILGKSVTIENRAGGGGWIGWGSLAASLRSGRDAKGVEAMLEGANRPREGIIATVIGIATLLFAAVGVVAASARKCSGEPFTTVNDGTGYRTRLSDWKTAALTTVTWGKLSARVTALSQTTHGVLTFGTFVSVQGGLTAK